MKLCVECKHLTPLGMCVSPANGISPVTGTPKPMFASERRSPGESVLFPGPVKCGPTANHFEPKPHNVTPLWMFWKKEK